MTEAWSDGIPFFLLERVVGLLSFDDALRARLVCRSWRDAVATTIRPFLVDLEIFLDHNDEGCPSPPSPAHVFYCRVNVDYLFAKESGFVGNYLRCQWPPFVRVRGIDIELSVDSWLGPDAFLELLEWLEHLARGRHFDALYSVVVSSMNASEISSADFARFLAIFRHVNVFNLHDVSGLHSECVLPFVMKLMRSERCERIDFIGCFGLDHDEDALFNPLQAVEDVPQRRLSLDFSDSPTTAVTIQDVVDFVEKWMNSRTPLVFEMIRLHVHATEQRIDLSHFCRLHCGLCRWTSDPEAQGHVHSFGHRLVASLLLNVDHDVSSVRISCFLKACSKPVVFAHDGRGLFKISSTGRVALHVRTVSRHDALLSSVDRKRLFINDDEVEVRVSWEQVPSKIPFNRTAIISVEFEWIELCPGLEHLFRWDWFASRSYHMSSLPHRRDWKSFLLEVQPSIEMESLKI
ncbi:hypothetical protein QR680_005658 [Steinernema hermaphroditum]|uniref:F-box domain-containing protein n=1 Tax=Steinernema hermaphroditum TaxID=289476 RepID=A0AA39LVB0_9BILA|nr:hypothetical protein QR680_005658 [Steinernema hermaphroditum]